MIKVVFCIPGRNFSYKFVLSWSNLLNSCPPLFNVAPLVRMAQAANIYMVRDLCLGGNNNGAIDQKPFDDKLDYDYIMWIDSDGVFEPQQFKTLLDQMERNKKYSILSGLYLLEDGRYSAHFDPKVSHKDGFIKPDDVEGGLGTKTFKVLYAGMGFMLIRRGVFESLSFPWFIPATYKGSGGANILMGEDATFCLRAKQAGFDTWINPKVIIGHEKPVVLK